MLQGKHEALLPTCADLPLTFHHKFVQMVNAKINSFAYEQIWDLANVTEIVYLDRIYDIYLAS